MKINKQGIWGETYAARYMRDNGYELLAGNFRSRFGEIDIVGRKDGYLCFVEVKTSNEKAISTPKEAVDYEKQQNIIATSKLYIQAYGYPEQPRFDVCEVIIDSENKLLNLNYIENAFYG